eukprot:142143-Amphidinium_carterae.1
MGAIARRLRYSPRRDPLGRRGLLCQSLWLPPAIARSCKPSWPGGPTFMALSGVWMAPRSRRC